MPFLRHFLFFLHHFSSFFILFLRFCPFSSHFRSFLTRLTELPSTATSPTASLHGSVRPFPSFDARSDAAAVRQAVKGLGTNEAVLIDVIGRRTNAQRQEIKRVYREQFNVRKLMVYCGLIWFKYGLLCVLECCFCV